MPTAILPSSAAAYKPRLPPIVLLEGNVPWLEQILTRVKQGGRPLNNLIKQTEYLTEVLTPKSAVWVLCSVMLENTIGINPWCPAMPESRLWIAHIEAYVVHVDMVSQNEVVFKLTEETIDGLIKYYKEAQSLDAATYSSNWPQKQAQLDNLHEEFSKAINKFVYRADVNALEALEEDGSGELGGDCRVNVKSAILKLFVPLTPPLGTELVAERLIHPLEEYQSSNTESRLSPFDPKNHSCFGDGLNTMHSSLFPVASVGGSPYATGPDSTVKPIPPWIMYSPIAAASAESFDGGSSCFEAWAETIPQLDSWFTENLSSAVTPSLPPGLRYREIRPRPIPASPPPGTKHKYNQRLTKKPRQTQSGVPGTTNQPAQRDEMSTARALSMSSHDLVHEHPSSHPLDDFPYNQENLHGPLEDFQKALKAQVLNSLRVLRKIVEDYRAFNLDSEIIDGWVAEVKGVDAKTIPITPSTAQIFGPFAELNSILTECITATGPMKSLTIRNQALELLKYILAYVEKYYLVQSAQVYFDIGRWIERLTQTNMREVE